MGGGVRRLSWRFVPSSTLTSRAARARHTITKPVLEPLEGRQLLALFTGFSHVRNVPTRDRRLFFANRDGPGVLKTQPAGGGSFDVIVLGTTDASTLMITQVRPRFHVANGLMSIDNLTIRSGQIGSILASPVELDGVMSPVNSGMNTLEFGALGPGARIDVNGGVNTMDVGSVGSGAQIDVNGSVSTMDLGPVESGAKIVINGSVSTMDVGSVQSGAIDVSGNVSTMDVVGSVQSGAIDVSGNVSTMTIGSVGSGAIDVSGNVGTMTIGSVGSSAQIDVNGSVGTMNVGSVNLGPGGRVVITGDLNSAVGTTIASMNLDGGQFVIGGDSLEPISIAGDLSLSYNGLLAIGRDQTGTLSVGGSVIIDSGGQLNVGRNLAAPDGWRQRADRSGGEWDRGGRRPRRDERWRLSSRPGLCHRDRPGRGPEPEQPRPCRATVPARPVTRAASSRPTSTWARTSAVSTSPTASSGAGSRPGCRSTA